MARHMGKREAAEELSAEFQTHEGAVFTHVREAIEPEASAGWPRPGHVHVLGVDWARLRDASAVAVVDATMGSCVHVKRITHQDFRVQIDEVEAVARRARAVAIYSEVNSIGDPLTMDLERRGLPTRSFVTTAQSKGKAIQALALALEMRRLTIPDDPVLVHELLSYQAQARAGGLPRYGAPPGQHDDTVMALSLAWWGAMRSVW
jgi:hypothetical protein